MSFLPRPLPFLVFAAALAGGGVSATAQVVESLRPQPPAPPTTPPAPAPPKRTSATSTKTAPAKTTSTTKKTTPADPTPATPPPPQGFKSLLEWKPIAELPLAPGQVKPGLSGVFAGPLNATHALVAGGTFYGDKGPLEGGTKQFTDSIFVLEQKPAATGAPPHYEWVPVTAKLPRPLAYGVSIPVEDGVVCLGGTDGQSCFSDCFLLRWNEETRDVERIVWPELPQPLAYAGGARAGSWLVVVGGSTRPGEAARTEVYGLNLSLRNHPTSFQWETFPALPRPVVFPVCAGHYDGTSEVFYVLSGRDLSQPDAAPYTDGIKFNLVTRSWSNFSPIQPAGAATPVSVLGGTAVAVEPRRLLVLGGDDGEIARLLEANARHQGTEEEKEAYAKFNAALLAAHPGYRREALLYDAPSATWQRAGYFPTGTPAVTPAFLWDGAVVLAGGESSPGQRSATVWLGEFTAE